MRAIKFRGKRKRSGDWVYGDFYHSVDGHACIGEWEVDERTVGQFTGLFDSTDWTHLTYGRRMDYAQQDFHGVEIYEGDIVKWGDHCGYCREAPVRIAEVKIGPDLFFASQVGDFHYGNFIYTSKDGSDTLEHVEVIGNIYEDGDLVAVAAR